MFASIFKIMFAGVGQPLQSRADQKPVAHSGDPPPASSARRQQVKAQSVKPTAAAKAAAPAAPAKKAGKPAAGVAPPEPAAPAKAADKKTAAAAVKAPAKAEKPTAKAAPKSAPASAKAPPAAAKPAKVLSSPPSTVSKASMIQPVKAAVPPAPAPAASAPGIPPRSPRPSSRLAQLTVPSMAQSVASTAAKASYLQTMPTSMIAPPSPMAAKKDAKLANNWKTKAATELTDEEVLAMPDSEYMNDKQMAYFRIMLVTLKRDMLNNAGETTEHLREDTVVVPDPADRATIEEEHALELRTRDRERKLLKKIEQSIQRIDAGDYGYCDETGEPIGVGRLLARPTATLSLEAQQRRELKQKMFGD